jgi:Tfp pilus assembly protein PilV
MTMPTTPPRRDEGSILPIALVVSVVLSIVVMGLASYTTTALKYGQVVENRADRLSAAEAGLRHMLEQEQEAGGLCTTALGGGAGTTMKIPDTISGASVEINCKQVGSTLSNITAWAVVITGEGGVPDGQGLVTTSGNGQTKVFGGPSYIARTGLLGIGAPLEMRDGNLWYTDGACEEGGEYVSNGSGFGSLSFSPASRGLWCTNQTWSQMFREPSIGTVPNVVDPPYEDIAGCRVFVPGRYTVTPEWGANTYLKSGNYYFNTGLMPLKQVTVTAGREGVGGSQQEVDNPPCDAIRDGDTPTGATLYLDGSSSFQMQTQGALEVLRRQQNYDLVAIQALPTSTLDYTVPILATDTGNKKQLSIQGMVWAPRSTIEFGEVTNVTAAQLTGGAVVASLKASASASITGFVIQVAGSPQKDKLQYTATATKDGTTQVRVIAQARFSKPATGGGVGTWEFVVNSWRVCDGLC